MGSNPTFSAIRLSPTAGKAFFHSLRRSSPKFSRHVQKPLFYKGFGAHPQSLFHCLCRGELGPGVQVGVDVGGRTEVAVPQPLLDLLHGDAVFQQQAGATMAQVVEADGAKPVALEQYGKGRADVASRHSTKPRYRRIIVNMVAR